MRVFSSEEAALWMVSNGVERDEHGAPIINGALIPPQGRCACSFAVPGDCGESLVVADCLGRWLSEAESLAYHEFLTGHLFENEVYLRHVLARRRQAGDLRRYGEAFWELHLAGEHIPLTQFITIYLAFDGTCSIFQSHLQRYLRVNDGSITLLSKGRDDLSSVHQFLGQMRLEYADDWSL